MANWIKAIYFVVILAWVKLMYFTTYIFDLAYERGEQKCAPLFLGNQSATAGSGS